MAPPLRVEPERPLDEGTEWIVGRIGAPKVFGGLQNRGLTDSQTRTGNIYSWISRFFADTLQRVSPRIRESAEYIRPNRWASLYLELHRMSLYPSVDLRMVCQRCRKDCT